MRVADIAGSDCSPVAQSQIAQTPQRTDVADLVSPCRRSFREMWRIPDREARNPSIARIKVPHEAHPAHGRVQRDDGTSSRQVRQSQLVRGCHPTSGPRYTGSN